MTILSTRINELLKQDKIDVTFVLTSYCLSTKLSKHVCLKSRKTAL